MTDSVLLDTTDGVLTITWNEPDRLNALTADMLNDAAAAIDSPVREMSPEAREWVAKEHVPGNKTYPDRGSILARFRTLPADAATPATTSCLTSPLRSSRCCRPCSANGGTHE